MYAIRSYYEDVFLGLMHGEFPDEQFSAVLAAEGGEIGQRQTRMDEFAVEGRQYRSHDGRIADGPSP